MVCLTSEWLLVAPGLLPVRDCAYTVRDVFSVGTAWYLRFEELVYPPRIMVQGSLVEDGFSEKHFSPARREVDYSDVLNPRARWVADADGGTDG